MIDPAHLADLIHNQGLTPAELAHRAQINPANLSLYLAGRGQPCPREQQLLALALATTIPALHDQEEAWAA